MRKLATLFFAAMTLNAHAGMLVDKTRVIFHEGEDTQGINVMNINAYPAFVQVLIISPRAPMHRLSLSPRYLISGQTK